MFNYLFVLYNKPAYGIYRKSSNVLTPVFKITDTYVQVSGKLFQQCSLKPRDVEIG